MATLTLDGAARPSWAAAVAIPTVEGGEGVAAQTVTAVFTNDGGSPITVTGLTKLGSFFKPFSSPVIKNPGNVTVVSSGSTFNVVLAPGETLTFEVGQDAYGGATAFYTFPFLAPGAYVGGVQVNYDSTNIKGYAKQIVLPADWTPPTVDAALVSQRFGWFFGWTGAPKTEENPRGLNATVREQGYTKILTTFQKELYDGGYRLFMNHMFGGAEGTGFYDARFYADFQPDMLGRLRNETAYPNAERIYRSVLEYHRVAAAIMPDAVFVDYIGSVRQWLPLIQHWKKSPNPNALFKEFLDAFGYLLRVPNALFHHDAPQWGADKASSWVDTPAYALLDVELPEGTINDPRYIWLAYCASMSAIDGLTEAVEPRTWNKYDFMLGENNPFIGVFPEFNGFECSVVGEDRTNPDYFEDANDFGGPSAYGEEGNAPDSSYRAVNTLLEFVEFTLPEYAVAHRIIRGAPGYYDGWFSESFRDAMTDMSTLIPKVQTLLESEVVVP